MKGRISRQIGIPLTRSGRQRKVGRAMGCCVALALAASIFVGVLPLLVGGVSSLYAHSGRLDDLGCHYDRKNGGYHCHQGPLAGRSFRDRQDAEKALRAIRQAQPVQHESPKK
jgi:hypothetical protein